MVVLVIASMNRLVLILHDTKPFHYDILFFELEPTMRPIHLVPFIPNHNSFHTIVLPIPINSDRIFNILDNDVLSLPLFSPVSHITIVYDTSILINHFVLSIDVLIFKLVEHPKYVHTVLKVSPTIHLHFISQLLNTFQFIDR